MNISIQSFSIKPKLEPKATTPSLFGKIQEAKEAKPENAEELVSKGIEAAEAGEMGRALSLLNHAFALDGTNFKCCEMIAQIHLMQGRPYGAVKYATKCVSMKPDWCEGYITLARSQREMGEVILSLKSYETALSLIDNAQNMDESEKNEIRQEKKELEQLYNKYVDEHGELQGRAHVVEDMEAMASQCGDYCSMRETWKEEIKNSILEMQEREEEKMQRDEMELED